MDIQDIFWLSYKDLSEKRVRTALTIVMVIIGVAAIVALTSFTAGINQSITATLESLGPTSIIVSSSGATGFTQADAGQLETLPNITSVTPLLLGEGTLYAGNQNVSVSIVGVSTQGLSQLLGGNVTLYQGTEYQDTIAPDALVGHSVAFPSTAADQQAITVGQSASLKLASGRAEQTVTVPVVGILPSHGTSIIPIDTGVFVSLQSAEILLHRSSFNEMLVLSSNLSNVNSTAALITTIYGSSVRVTTISAILSTVSTIIGGIALLFGVIAGVSLLVAAIGIMNIMLMSVMERTHEIGIMKSIGFKNKHVMLVFMLQALIIGVVGGIAGIAVGAVASIGLAAAASGASSGSSPTSTPAAASSGGFRGGGAGGSAAAGGGSAVFVSGGSTSSSSTSSLSFSPAFPLSTVGSALLVAVIVSVVAGLYPAWRASKMEPIDALREL